MCNVFLRNNAAVFRTIITEEQTTLSASVFKGLEAKFRHTLCAFC